MCCMEHIDVTVLRLFFRIEESSGFACGYGGRYYSMPSCYFACSWEFLSSRSISALVFADFAIFSCQHIMIPAYYMRFAAGLAPWKQN